MLKKMSLKPFCFEPIVEEIDSRIDEQVSPIQTINYVGRSKNSCSTHK